MDTIGKEIDEVIKAILAYEDPETQSKFIAVGFVCKNGTGEMDIEPVSLDKPETLGKDEYRVIHSNSSGKERIADLTTNYKNREETFVFRRFPPDKTFGPDNKSAEEVYTTLLEAIRGI